MREIIYTAGFAKQHKLYKRMKMSIKYFFPQYMLKSKYLNEECCSVSLNYNMPLLHKTWEQQKVAGVLDNPSFALSPSICISICETYWALA